LALDPEETAGAPPPAEIFRRWPGWRNRWDGPPRWLDEPDWVDLAKMRGSIPPALPAETWARLTGDAGHAALLVEGSQPASRLLRCPAEYEGELLNLLSEASALLAPTDWWRASFTTCLQPSDAAADFRWAAIRAGSVTEATMPRSGMVIDLSKPSQMPAAPENASARRARATSLPSPAPAAPVVKPMTRPETIASGKISAPTSPTAPVRPPATPVPSKPGSLGWVTIAVAGLVLGGVIFIIVSRPGSAPPTMTPPPAPPPTPVYTPPKSLASTNAESAAETQSPEASSGATTDQTAVNNEQTLADIMQMGENGKALAALARWKDLSTAAPDFAAAHIDELNNRLLPAARKEWLAALAQITVDLNAGKSSRADLAARFAALHDFPRAWPVNNPDELERAEAAVAAIFNALDELPDAPVWIIDNFATTGTSADYQDCTVTLSIPELNSLLATDADKFTVAAAPATSLQPPSADQWFNFSVLGVDYEPGNFLILHDASRGAAGGRFMQLLEDQSGKVKLTWRLFQPNSDFYQRFPANAPLRPVSRNLWLRFAGQPPLPSVYLLLRHAGVVAEENWKPVMLPLDWLDQQGSPVRVTLPSWLANNLNVHAPTGQSFHLEPANVNPAAWGIDAIQPPAVVAGQAQYEASRLISPLEDKFRFLQTELARAQQRFADLQSASVDPTKSKPTPGAVDQAAETVKKLQASLDEIQSAARAAAQPGWALAVSPWLLDDNLSTATPIVLLEFTNHETRPSP
jgi:hypothetical protein